MTFDVGRTRHDMQLMHYSIGSNGLAVPSNWVPRATGDTGIGWSPESASSVSYGSNSNDVAAVSAAGASTLVSRADHVHRGVTSLSHTSNTFYGPVILTASGTVGITSPTPGTYNISGTSSGSGGGGGGGSGPSDYVSGPSGSGQIIIPGLYGSADIRVAGGNDDEFDTTDTSDPMTGWTTLGSPTAHDINSSVKSHYYLTCNAAALGMHGIYKACPSIPFTLTAELADYNVAAGGNARAQIAVLEASPGKFLSFGWSGNGLVGVVNGDIWTNRTTYASTPIAATNAFGVRYLRMVVTSSTNITCWVSLKGSVWIQFGGTINPGFTVGAIGLVGEGHTSGQAMQLLCDWVRCT